MNILQISSTDLIGKRFNGQYLTEYFNTIGHPTSHLVWSKEGENPNTHEMLKFPGRNRLTNLLDRAENKLSIRSVLHPSSHFLRFNRHFKQADVAHYQIMHWPNYFSMMAYPALTKLKPSVLTVHDFWPMTGHCVYPADCTRWQTGCGSCPRLETNFSMRVDHTRGMFNFKKSIYNRSQFEIVVASQYMKNYVDKSPMFKNYNIHHVPFGLDLNIYKPTDQNFSKKILGIDSEEITISLRAAPGEFKGLEYIKEALRNLKTDKKICLLTFNVKGQLEEFRSKFKIVDLGWVNDESLTLHAYSATDFFLMPSTHEAFGMMAMEAMTFGKPVVVFEGTSLPEIVGGPETGLVVPMKNVGELLAAIDRLTNNDQFRFERGQKALEFAQKNYRLEDHMRKLLVVYNSAVVNFKKEKGSGI